MDLRLPPELTKAFFDLLFARRGSIEAELGRPVEWERLDNRQGSRLALRRAVPEVPPFENNDELKTWAVETMTVMSNVLRPIVRTL